MTAGVDRWRPVRSGARGGAVSFSAASRLHLLDVAAADEVLAGNLGDDEIAGMLKESFSHAGDDAFRRALREAQVEAQRLVEATQSALQDDADLLSIAERAQIDAALTRLRAMMIGDDRRAMDDAMQALSTATNEFAARRMNQSVRRALAGRNVDQLSP